MGCGKTILGGALGAGAGFLIGGPLGAGIGAGMGLGAGSSLDAAGYASDAAAGAAAAQLQAQREQLAYLKEVDALPREYREAALKKLNEMYNTPGGGQQIISEAMQSPLYSAIMGGQKAGEQAILRNQAATGGLRSGSTQSNLVDFNTNLQNTALLTAYEDRTQGLKGLANLPSQSTNIATTIGNMGTTAAQGIQAQGQAFQQGLQGVTGAIGSGVQNYLFAKGKGLI